MRLPLDIADHGESLKVQHGGSLTAAVVAALREAWKLPEPVKVEPLPSSYWAA